MLVVFISTYAIGKVVCNAACRLAQADVWRLKLICFVLLQAYMLAACTRSMQT